MKWKGTWTWTNHRHCRNHHTQDTTRSSFCTRVFVVYFSHNRFFVNHFLPDNLEFHMRDHIRTAAGIDWRFKTHPFMYYIYIYFSIKTARLRRSKDRQRRRAARLERNWAWKKARRHFGHPTINRRAPAWFRYGSLFFRWAASILTVTFRPLVMKLAQEDVASSLF